MFCTKCGTKLDDYACVCNNCGKPVVRSYNQPAMQYYNPPARKKKKAWIFLVIFLILGVATAATMMHKGGKKTGKAERTIMLYMIGSNLESNNGLATKQINEILKSNISSKINVVIETGGAKKWFNGNIADGMVQRSVVVDNSIEMVKKVGKVKMSETKELADFISWTKDNYPADTYSIIFFNHGGSATGGYGNDELFQMDSMLLDEMEEAFRQTDIQFDFIGFDACNMATFETAYIFKDYAEYLVASESVEYMYSGWNYTGFLNAIYDNPSISTREICREIVSSTRDEYEDFIKNVFPDGTYTISVIDLGKMDDLYKAFCDFFADVNKIMLNGESAGNAANIRYYTKHFGSPETELIDMVHFSDKCNTDYSESFSQAVKDAVICHESNVYNSSGLGMYIPYCNLEYFESTYNSISKYIKNKDYLNFIKSFASVMVYLGDGNKNYKWYDEDTAKKCVRKVSVLSTDGQTPFKKNSEGIYTWNFTKKEMEQIVEAVDTLYATIRNKTYKFGNVDITDDISTSLSVTKIRSWYGFKGVNSIAPIYYQGKEQNTKGEQFTYSYIPAKITPASTGEKIDVYLVACFTDSENGTVSGYIERNNELNTLTMVTIPFNKGDVITICFEEVNSKFEKIREVEDYTLPTYDGRQLIVEKKGLDTKLTFYCQKVVKDLFGKIYNSPVVKM